MKSDWRLLIVIGLLSFALVSRIGLFTYAYHDRPACIIMDDSASYDNPARALLHLGRFAAGPERPDTPEVIRTPGYPVFIAFCYSLFGEKHAPVIVLQIIISVSIIWLTYLLGLRLGSPRAALLGAALLALDPASCLQSQLLLTETLFTFLILLIAFAGLKAIAAQRNQAIWAFWLGLAIALSAHVRPISYYLIFPVLPCLLYVKKRQKLAWGGLVKIGVALVIPWLVLVAGWQIRNLKTAGRPEFSYIQSYNILYYRAAGIIALRDHLTLTQAQEKITKENPDIPGMSVAEKCERWQRGGTAIIRQNPGLFVKMQIKGLLKLILSMPGGDLSQYLGHAGDQSPFRDILRLPVKQYLNLWVFHNPCFLLIFLLALLMLVVSYGGLFLAPWRTLTTTPPGLPAHLFLVGLTVYLLLISAGPEAYFRFRVPAMPLIYLYSALGWERIFLALRKRLGK